MSNTTVSLSRYEVVARLYDVQEQFRDLVKEAKKLLRASGCEGARMRAESYWIAHITTAISNDHEFLGGSFYTLDDTIKEIDQSGENEHEHEEDEG